MNLSNSISKTLYFLLVLRQSDSRNYNRNDDFRIIPMMVETHNMLPKISQNERVLPESACLIKYRKTEARPSSTLHSHHQCGDSWSNAHTKHIREFKTLTFCLNNRLYQWLPNSFGLRLPLHKKKLSPNLQM
jgi:hypothetical protein